MSEELNGLKIFFKWLKENNLTDRIPNPIDFKIEQLKEAIKKEEANIRGAKNNFRELFSMDEYEFGRQQYSVQSTFENLTKAYDNYIQKSNSLESDIAKLRESVDESDVSFLLDIEELDLSKSDITELPKEIIELKKLKNLNISNTKISKIDSKIVNGYSFTIDISGTSIEITKEFIENLKEGKYGTLNVKFDENTKIADDCKNEGFVKSGIRTFIENEKDSIKKVKLANEYGIKELSIDPNTLTDEFFKQDFSNIKFIDMMRDSVDEAMAKKVSNLGVNIAFAYDTTVGNLEKKILAEADNPEDIKKYPEDVWYGVDYEDRELELTVVSYLDFDADYEPNNKDIANAVYSRAFNLKTSGEKVIVMESYDYEFKVVSLDSEDCLGELEWEYYSTDTNDGVLERYVNYCSAEFCDISIEDILAFRLGYIEASDLADEYNIDYDCEQEGYYG